MKLSRGVYYIFENTQKNFKLNLVLVLVLESKGLYCSCKQDTKERQWRQQFCQMERDILVHQTEITRPVKEDHLQSWSRIFRSDQTEMVHSINFLMYQCTNQNFWNFGLNGKSAPDFNPLFFHGFIVLSNPEVRSIMFMDRRDWMQAGR